jgi:Xaa-Pro aminopeptidase
MDTRPDRLAALRGSLAAAERDALLVTALPNIRYLTGFSGSSALLVVTATDALFISDFRYDTQAREEVGDVARVVIEPVSLWSHLWQALPGLGVEVIAFESAHVTWADAQRFVDNGAKWQWRPAVGLVEELRQSKDAGEIAHIRAAVGIAERALERLLPQIRPGLTELAIAGMLEMLLRQEGSEAYPFETIIASGERSALPHARASERVVATGDLLLIDYGAVSGGYCSDITRTFVVGKPTDEQQDVFDVVRESNATASGGVRAGMRGKDADELARGYIHRRGWGPQFGHSLGHGIGLEVHEAPRLAASADAPLPLGSVVTIEPGIYRPGWGGVRIEDDVVLSVDGATVLTSFPRTLLSLG